MSLVILSIYSRGKAGDTYCTTAARHPLRFRFVREQRCLSRDGTEARSETRMVIEGNKVAERKLQAVT